MSVPVPARIIPRMSAPHGPAFEHTPLYARVALPLPVATEFTYEVPGDLATRVLVGCRVEVPFGQRVLDGFVVGLSDRSDVARTKPIRRVLETYLTKPLLDLAGWMASYYGCSVGEAAQTELPSGVRRSSRRARFDGVVRLRLGDGGLGALRERLKNAPRQMLLAERVAEMGGEARMRVITGEWGFSAGHVKSLIDKGAAEEIRTPVLSPLEAIDAPIVELTPDQDRAMERIVDSISSQRFSALLLHGVTGSGKTEIYLRAAQFALSRGEGCIVLVPEISLLPQAVARYRKIFGARMAVIHSRLTGAERFEIWNMIEKKECRVVLGPRSAVFSPIANLRLIIVDEEQDDSYKQEDKPRYHARHVALMRGKHENLTVILGSATPSAESFHHALDGRYTYLSLPTRVGGASMPKIEFVDLRKEPMETASCSSHLLERLEAHVLKGHQSILFLNKRGHARFVQCNACGWVAKCKNCDIALTYHRVTNRLKCHYCGYNRGALVRCDQCGGSKLFFAGSGTQRVELDLASLLPGVGILRMDADTTAGKEGHQRVLEQFSTGKYPILIGTQMVAKGHHFPQVNLVGVLHAEESLNYPDFRSSERTFQQLIQVAGRAGRAGSESEVVIQTFTPEHHVFKYLTSHDYNGFMKEELAVRRELRYPPFTRIVLASCSAAGKDSLHRVVQSWADDMRRRFAGSTIEILGPVPPPVERVKNKYREHLLIRGKLSTSLKNEILRAYRRTTERERGGSAVELRWDVDPESFG